MSELGQIHKSILECNTRPVVHMRSQARKNRLGLVFGSGFSRPFGIPAWTELINMLADDPKIQGKRILKMAPLRSGLPYRTEMLFEHFKKRRYLKVRPRRHHTRPLDYEIGADWKQIVRTHLYSRLKGDLPRVLERHPYLDRFLALIQRSHMTVTYNFDDFIEQALLKSRPEDVQLSSRGFESVTNPWTQFGRTDAIIYHPNGVVPKNPQETPSDRFVFSEESFAEQLMGIFAGDQAGLLNHFSKNTCLFIGLSLEDDTLRNVLMQGARMCPGNFHYFVHHLKRGETLDEEKQHAITFANFKVYNLITLFLRDNGIRALGELINEDTCPTDKFCDFASSHNIPVRFRFYITGPLGVGKSTTISQFRNLDVLDEWLEQRLPILSKDWEKLTDAQRKIADAWIASQFGKKNDILRNKREGIFVCDRGPLDPLSFTPKRQWKSKAKMLLDTLCPGQAQWEVEDGRVVLLQGDADELSLRIISQRKEYSAGNLRKMETSIETAYGSNGVVRIDTRGLTNLDVTRRVAEIVHLENYVPTCNLHKRLKAIRREGIHVRD